MSSRSSRSSRNGFPCDNRGGVGEHLSLMKKFGHVLAALALTALGYGAGYALSHGTVDMPDSPYVYYNTSGDSTHYYDGDWRLVPTTEKEAFPEWSHPIIQGAGAIAGAAIVIAFCAYTKPWGKNGRNNNRQRFARQSEHLKR